MSQSPDQIRVVHLVRTLDVGGLEMVVLDLVRKATRSTFEPIVVCLGNAGELAPRFEAEGVRVVSLEAHSVKLPQSVGRLAKLLRTLRPQILHTHNPGPHLQGALASLMTRIPVLVHTKHGRNYTDNRIRVAANRIISGLTNRIVSVSEDSAQVAREIERVPSQKVLVIHNGIDLDRFPIRPRRETRPIHRAITVARLNLIKDQGTMLRAVKLVTKIEPDFHLDLIGDGPSRAELEALRDQLELGDKVRFLGTRSDVHEQLAEADLFLLSSISEGISLTLLEAMAVGLPVVATDVGGNGEVVAHDETGLLVPAQSPEAMAQAILQMIADPEAANQMGVAGRHRVEKEFNLDRVVLDYENLYLTLLGSRKRVESLEPSTT